MLINASRTHYSGIWKRPELNHHTVSLRILLDLPRELSVAEEDVPVV